MMIKAQQQENLSPTAFIARSIIQLGLAARLPTTPQYQDYLGIGSGTVQKALLELKKTGAVELVSRGHKGTFVVAWNFPRLWDAARMPPVHILLPPRGSLEATLIASAIAQQCREWGVLTTIGYLRGARSRLKAFQQEAADIVLMSSGSAQNLLQETATTEYTTFDLGSGTYYRPGSLVIVEKSATALTARPRVGIDFHSSDHQQLTYAQFPVTDYEYIEIDFTLLPRAVFLGDIDTGVWHLEDSLIPLADVGLTVRPLQQPAALKLAADLSAAVLVAQLESPVTRLLQCLDTERIRHETSQVDHTTMFSFSTQLPIRFL